MAVHHVHVEHADAGMLDAGDIICQAGEVRREN
jgi:hypothetical protein